MMHAGTLSQLSIVTCARCAAYTRMPRASMLYSFKSMSTYARDPGPESFDD